MAVSHMLSHVSAGDWIGYIAALLVFLTFWMKTMVSLRMAGIASNFLFIAYGYLVAAYPPLVLHVCLLPLNLMRLQEMLQLTKRVEAAARGDLNMNWIKPFTTSRHMRSGEVMFHRGDTADRTFHHRHRPLPADRERHRDRARRRGRRTRSDLARQDAHADIGMRAERPTAGDHLWTDQAALFPESHLWLLFP
jgi:hypothetical protein